jgi:anti-anti-sigma regulatory factor
MTWKIEKRFQGERTVIRLIGRIQAENLAELEQQLEGIETKIVFDLSEVMIVDVDVVRFFGGCKEKGVELQHCSPYIRDWIVREQNGEGLNPERGSA